ncbi:MAG: hypothetical protein H6733_16940 [Alphaproteobacteria bacterium]|nr:hypothetical protein [Alphaproteobacteria bacterium]
MSLLVAAVAWAQSMGGFLSPGELAAPHADLSGVTDCLACHEVGAGVSATRCMTCHDTVRDQVTRHTGFHADKGTTCERCHPDHRGSDFHLVQMDTTSFDHTPTGFALKGAHARAACEDCHTTPGTWTGLSTGCVDCHGDDDPHGRAAGHARLEDCASCHDTRRWSAVDLTAVRFDHTDPKQVDFTLHGQHTDVACTACHDAWHFAPVAAEACVDCHDDLHHGQFAPRTCDTCHTVDVPDFSLRGFDHTTTDWPLTRGHKGVACEACHGDGAKGRYVDLPHDRCSTCHADPHGGQFSPRDCVACHDPDQTSFALSSFDHDRTDFPLHGAHADVACETCHGPGTAATFSDLPFDDCTSCHDDPHAARFAPDRCDSCHTDGSWQVTTFDHGRTDFPLTGAHTEVACETCHGPEEAHALAGLPHAACTDCHADDDPHGGTPTTASCTVCHVTAAWAQVDVPHETLTGFALAGRHAPLACTACHDDPGFVGADPACASCHEPDRPRDHFEGDCGGCHLVDGWAAASLGGTDHASTGFPLHGAHTTLPCDACHTGAPSLGPFCTDCHADDDPHRNLLGNACETCHGPLDWSFVRFAHATTGWPLRGAHAVAACVDCHPTGYVGTPTACRRCHEADRPHDALHADPVTATCDVCHRPYAWEPTRWPGGGDR